MQIRRFWFITDALPDDVKEVTVQRGVVIEFRVERRDELAALPCGDNLAANLCEYAHPAARFLDVWRADEGHWYLAFYPLERPRRMETAELPAVGVAPREDVHRADMLAVEQYQPGARPHDRQPALYGFAYGLEHLLALEQQHHRGALSARYHQRVLRLVPVAQFPHLEGLGAEPAEHTLVFYESTL